MDTEIFLSFSGGSYNESVVWTAYGFGEVDVPLYLTVKVFPNAIVKSNSSMIILVNEFFRPGNDCGQEFYTFFKDTADIVSDILVSICIIVLIAISRRTSVKSSSILSQYSLEAYVDFELLHRSMSMCKFLIFLPFQKSEFRLRSRGLPTLW